MSPRNESAGMNVLSMEGAFQSLIICFSLSDKLALILLHLPYKKRIEKIKSGQLRKKL